MHVDVCVSICTCRITITRSLYKKTSWKLVRLMKVGRQVGRQAGRQAGRYMLLPDMPHTVELQHRTQSNQQPGLWVHLL